MKISTLFALSASVAGFGAVYCAIRIMYTGDVVLAMYGFANTVIAIYAGCKWLEARAEDRP